ncbi:Ig-like domain-containing protein [Longimicrobium sp.]|jgi:hypothetical protein|uniref:Ig-like domain-containing protein n=1 Tax=Longimicrobium sp. TaxID=2029185 RepID=UPI002F93D3D0
MITGVTPGQASIRAETGGKAGEFLITVNRVPVGFVTISPGSASLQAGATFQFSATVKNSAGAVLTDRFVTWTSTNTSVATVNGSGLVTASGIGSATIIAASEGVQGQATVQVTPPPFARALPDGRARIHPSVIQGSGFDASKTLWVAWAGNQYLQRFENEAAYQPVQPNPVYRLQLVTSGDEAGWYETALPVVGTCFTVVQFAGNARRWANLVSWNGVAGIHQLGSQHAMKLPDDGQAAARLNRLIQVDTAGGRRHAFVAHALLPTEQLANPWRMVGSSNDWAYPTGRPVTGAGAAGFTFDVSGLRRFANVTASSTAGTSVWGLFGHLGDGSIDLSNAGCMAPNNTGFRDSDIRVDGGSAGIWLEPAEMPARLPHLFVNGLEGQVGWPNPNAPPAHARGTFTAATPWLTIVDDMRAPEPSWVEIDYLRLWAVVGGRSELVQENSYSDGRLGGTLASRDKWFEFRWDELQQRATVANGIVRLPLSTVSDKAWHVWIEDTWTDPSGTHFRRLLPPNTERVWVETRIRLRGAAALQIGWDYYRHTKDKNCDIDLDGDYEDGWCEAGKSEWIFESFDNDGWQVIRLGL